MGFKQKNGYIKVPYILWIATGITILSLLCLHTYNDVLITAKQGYNFWNLLFSGRPQDFYKEAVMTSGNDYYPNQQFAAYLFPVYLTFAVWNLPTWVVSRIIGAELFNTTLSMIWMKLMLVPFIILSARCIFNIVKELKESQKYALLAAFFFVSSITVIYPVALIGQYDIITVFLILFGFEGWLSGKKAKFVISFAAAICFKYFALLYFLPLLFLTEKRIRVILLRLVEVALPAVFFMFIFSKPEGQVSNVSNLLGLMLQGIKFNEGIQISLFPLVFAFVLVACYFTKISEESKLRYATYYLFLIMGSFCVLINPYPYWVVLAAPVLALICFTSNNINKTVIFETALGVCIAIKNYIIYYWCFCINTTGGMGILHRLLGKSKPAVDDYTSLLGVFVADVNVLTIVFTLTIAVFIVMAYFSRPNEKEEKLLEPFNIITVYARTVVNLVIALLPTLFLAVYTVLKG